jgi:hypothetical protein
MARVGAKLVPTMEQQTDNARFERDGPDTIERVLKRRWQKLPRHNLTAREAGLYSTSDSHVIHRHMTEVRDAIVATSMNVQLLGAPKR